MPLLSKVLAHDEPTLTNTAHLHALDCLFLCTAHTKQGRYECYHIPLARSLCDLTSLLFLQPVLLLRLLMHSVNLMASRTSRSQISTDSFYLIPRTLLCLQEWIMIMMMTMKLLLQECKAMTLLLQECQ